MEKVIALSTQETVNNGVNLKHKFFNYLQPCELKEIEAEIFMNKSYIVAFKDEKEIFGAAIFSVESDRIHIREVGGKYVRASKYAKEYAIFIAKKLERKFVSFVAFHKTIIKYALKTGWKNDPEFNNEFILEV